MTLGSQLFVGDVRKATNSSRGRATPGALLVGLQIAVILDDLQGASASGGAVIRREPLYDSSCQRCALLSIRWTPT